MPPFWLKRFDYLLLERSSASGRSLQILSITILQVFIVKAVSLSPCEWLAAGNLAWAPRAEIPPALAMASASSCAASVAAAAAAEQSANRVREIVEEAARGESSERERITLTDKGILLAAAYQLRKQLAATAAAPACGARAAAAPIPASKAPPPSRQQQRQPCRRVREAMVAPT